MRLRESFLVVAGILFLGFGNYAFGQIRQNAGFKANSIEANDDGSSPLTPIGWTLNFFGRFRSQVYVNNNGNITFDAPMPEYTPFGLTGVSREIIAPFFADVDTRASNSQLVTFGQDFVDGRKAFGVNYVDVGYFNTHGDKLNSFQMILIERPDTGTGNFDIEFNYQRIRWETGDASGGTNGYGGVPASVGWSNGSGQPGTSYELPGSLIPGSFLDDGPNSLSAGRTPGLSAASTAPVGRWVFRARGGQLIPPISIKTGCPVPNATAGRLYAYKMEAEGSRPPYKWSLQLDQDGSLPGLQMTQAGILSGSVPAPGRYSFSVRVSASDEDGEVSMSRRCSITVDPPSIFISNSSSLPPASAGQRYETRLRAEGGAGPFRFDLFESTDVPGLRLAQDGTITGVPAAQGTYQFQVRATSTGVDRAVASVKRFVITVRPSELSVRGACPLPAGTGGASYNYQFEADGGVAPYRWSVVGQLPTGMFLSGEGKLNGQPSVPHWWPFDVRVADSRGTVAQVGCGVVIRFPEVKIASACPLPAASTSVAYSQQLQATGGAGNYIWTVEGLVPSGLNLTRDGLLSGTPTSAGVSQFRVNATDSDGNTASTNCSLTTQRGAYSVASCPLPDGYEGEPYSAQVAAGGGQDPFVWTALGVVPSWLKFSKDGLLTGTPERAGTSPITMQVVDRNGQSAMRTCDLKVLPRALRIVNPCDFAVGTMGVRYSQKLAATGGMAPYTFTASALPGGVRLDADGTVSGVPEKAGSFPLSYSVKDASGSTTSVSCRVTVKVPELPDLRISGMPQTLSPASAGPVISLELSQPYPLPLEADAKLEVNPDTDNGVAGLDRADPSVLFADGQQNALITFPAGVRRAELRIAATGTVASTVNVSLSRLRVPGTTIEFAKQAAPAQGQLPRTAPTITSVCYTPSEDGLNVDVSGFSVTRELQSANLTFGSNRYLVSLTRSATDFFSSDDAVRTGGTFRIRAPYRIYQGNAKSLGDGSVVVSNRAGSSASMPIRRCN